MNDLEFLLLLEETLPQLCQLAPLTKSKDGGNSKHQGAIKAHMAGLLRRDSTSFFIRLGGTGIIADFLTGPYGELNPKVWSDIDDLDTLTSLPDTTPHRPVEKIIQAAAEEHGDKLKCAIICASGIHGKGRGMVRQQSLWMPDFYSEVIKFGATFYTGTGGNSRGWTHIDDLMGIYLALVDDAAQGGGAADWGKAVRAMPAFCSWDDVADSLTGVLFYMQPRGHPTGTCG